MELWLATKLLFSKKTITQTNTLVALAGLMIGVACLVVAMAVMSGFERTLRETVVDVAGHMQVYRQVPGNPDWGEVESRIFKMDPRIKESLPFVFLEAVMAHRGETLGVTLQGVAADRWQSVLNFSGRLLKGRLDISPQDPPTALIGKVLSERMHLNVGDRFRVVVPVADSLDPNRFGRRLGEFQVSGVLDYGKHEWNERFMIVNLVAAQEMAQIKKDRVNGLIFRLDDSEGAREVAINVSSQLGFGYSVRDWREFDANLFEASAGEKVVIFFVVFIIVLVAAFSVASSFYINMFQRYPDIAILKTLGVTRRSLIKIYGWQGLLMGIVGSTFGYVLGLTLCFLFVWGQRTFHLLPGSVYRLSEIEVQIRWVDTVAILGSTLVISVLASIFPARRGSRLNPVEGLHYD